MCALSVAEQKFALQPVKSKDPRRRAAAPTIVLFLLFSNVLFSEFSDCFANFFANLFPEFGRISGLHHNDDVVGIACGEQFIADGANLTLDANSGNRTAVLFSHGDSDAHTMLRLGEPIDRGEFATAAIVLVNDFREFFVFTNAVGFFHTN